MKLIKFAVPAALLGAAAIVTIPKTTSAYAVIPGAFHNASQNGFQVYPTSWLDASANANATPDANFPGLTGAGLALAKGAVEWNSELRGGNGNGDPLQVGGLGSGTSNFDFMFQGIVTNNGGTNSCVVAAVTTTLGAGVYAQTGQQFGGAGWFMNFDESTTNNWNWVDGPGNETGGLSTDIQGIAAHEFGHALGLDHSGDSSATMWSGVTPGGTPGLRSINSDDQAGEQSIYGAKSATKPKITAVTGSKYSLGYITVTGQNFGASGIEVWFTKDYAGTPEVNTPPTPVKVTGLTSPDGMNVTLQVPSGIADGDIAIHSSGTVTDHALKSAPFPFDLQAQPAYPLISTMTPNPISIAATATPLLTINGKNFTGATSVSVGTKAYPSGQFTIVNDTKITVDFNPPPNEIGSVSVSVTSPAGTSDPAPPISIALPNTSTGILFSDKINPAAGTNVTFYCAAPTPGQFPAIAYSQCIQTLPLLPYFTLSIGGCLDVNFLEGNPVFGANGISEFTVTVPATFHGIVFLQFVRIDLLGPIPPVTPWPVSNILTLIVP